MESSEETGEKPVCTRECMRSHPLLHQAVVEGDVKGVRGALTNPAGRAQINTLVHNLFAPLHMACKFDRLAVFKVLLENGADMELRDGQDRCTALHMVSCAGKDVYTSALLACGADCNSVDLRGRTPLWMAAQNGHQAVVRQLLSLGVDVNHPNYLGVTPLIAAELNGFVDTVESLVRSGASVNQADLAGNTPLMHAVRSGQRDTTRILIKAGANPNKPNQAGEYPVHIAAQHGNVDILDLLIEYGCDVNVGNMVADRPITVAARRRHVPALRKLIEGGADVDIQDVSTPLPLVEAIVYEGTQQGNLDVIKVLIQGGCDVNRQSIAFQLTPIEYALLNSRRVAAMLLLKADSDPPRKLDVDLSRDDPSLYSKVMRLAAEPLSMKRLCRKSIRKEVGFGRKYKEKVWQLTLPNALKAFLLYEDIGPFDQNLDR